MFVRKVENLRKFPPYDNRNSVTFGSRKCCNIFSAFSCLGTKPDSRSLDNTCTAISLRVDSTHLVRLAGRPAAPASDVQPVLARFLSRWT